MAIETQTVLVGDAASWRNLGPGRVLAVLPQDEATALDPGDELHL